MNDEYILAYDLGTYCDHVLMDNAISELAKKYKIVYLTDKTHKLPDNFIKVPFTTPDFFIKDPKIKIADTNHNIVYWAVTHMDKVIEAYRWSRMIRTKITNLIKMYKFKAICILYPALGSLWLLKNYNIPIYILYYAPGLVSENIPWLFDSRIKSSDYKLYDEENKDYNVESGLKYLKRLSMMSRRKESIHQILRSVNHVICWDKTVLPEPKYYYKDLKIHYAGAPINKKLLDKKKWSNTNKNVIDFIKKKDKIIFMSFGSYGDSPLLNKAVKSILLQAEEYCKNNNAGLIFHNGGNIDNTDHRLIINGFIQYEYIVPRSNLIIFTGSVCLQNICLYNCKPMLFVPLLNEQFYWAKNWKYMTNIEYINYKNPQYIDFDKIMQITKYSRSVSRSIKKADGAKAICKLICKND